MNTTASHPSTYNVRRFTEDDLRDVIAINLKCLPENYSSSFFLDLFHSCPETFLVANLSGNIVGYTMCRVESGFSELNRFKFAKKGHIVSVAVLPQHRRVGVGFALMIAGMIGMERYGCSESYLEVRESNFSAIKMYEKLGYRVLRTVTGYYFDGENACMMGRKLPIDKSAIEGFPRSKVNMTYDVS